MTKTSSRNGIRNPHALQEALSWLGAPPAHDPLRDLAPLRSHLVAIAAIGVPPLQYVKLLELFQARAEPARSTVKPLLLDATLPVTKHLRTVAQALMDIHAGIAAGYLKMLATAESETLAGQGFTPVRLCAAGLANLSQQYEVALLISAPAPPGLWGTATALRHLAAASSVATKAADAPTAERDMKAMLALAAAQPEGLSPRETVFLAAYLRLHADCVEIHAGTPTGDDADYWLDAANDTPPTATARRASPQGTATHFSCAALSRLAHRHLDSLARGERPEALGLPQAAISADYRAVLERAAARWAAAPKRETHRRRHGCRVQVCTHIGPLWRQLSSADPAEPSEFELPASDWMIVNESPSGYAVMHVAGTPAGIVVGAAVGLRAGTGTPWHICVVRWARSDNPEHLELGLELVAAQAVAVRVARRAAGDDAAPLPALLLPPLPALQRGAALLTTRGSFAPGPFALIDESNGRIRIAECTAERLAMHTACIEIFEFARQSGVG